MKTLHAFWHWFENEKPTAEQAREKAEANLSELGMLALEDGCDYVCVRAGEDHETARENVEWALEHQPVATRKLSLSICQALEAMHAEVAEPAPKPFTEAFGLVFDHGPVFELTHKMPGATRGLLTDEARAALMAQQPTFRREYLGEWVVGVDLGKDADLGKWAEREHDRNAAHAAQVNAATTVIGPDAYAGLAATFDCRVDPDARNHELHISPDMVPTLSSCDKLRGLAPRRVVLHSWRASYDEHVLRYLIANVLEPMVVDGALIIWDDVRFAELWRADSQLTPPPAPRALLGR